MPSFKMHFLKIFYSQKHFITTPPDYENCGKDPLPPHLININ